MVAKNVALRFTQHIMETVMVLTLVQTKFKFINNYTMLFPRRRRWQLFDWFFGMKVCRWQNHFAYMRQLLVVIFFYRKSILIGSGGSTCGPD
jgi:hypothetical protein